MLRACLSVALVLVLAACGGEQNGAQGEVAAVHPGEGIYLRSCFSCHASGVAGAPRVGDTVAWRERLAKGREVLLKSTVEGMPPGMPAKGMCFDCTDAQFMDAIDYMLVKSGVE